jgi:hypothetical protein
MVYVSDQFEVEALDNYSGSYTDGIFTPGSIFDGTRNIFMSNASPAVTSSFKNGFKLGSLTYLAPLFGRGLHIGLTDINYRDAINNVNVFAEVIGSHILLPENIPSPSKNLLLKLFSPTERFADTVLPRPPDISRVNGARFSEGIGEFLYPNGQQLSFVGSFFEVTPVSGAVERQPRMFNLTLGSHECSLTSSDDGLAVSDDVWAYSFPFESKYRHLSPLFKPSFDKKYIIALSQSLTGSEGVAFVTSGGLDLSCINHPSPFKSSMYTLQYCFATKGIKEPWPNRKRHITLLKTPTSASNGIFKPIYNNLYPDISFIYKGFYGFYKELGASPPYMLSIDGEGVAPWSTGLPGDSITEGTTPSSSAGFTGSEFANVTRKLKHNGFGRFFPENQLLNGGKFPVHPTCNGFAPDGGVELFSSVDDKITATVSQYAVIDFNNFFLRTSGWKYGVYHADPSYSFCCWRRSKFGQFRDMLEQRPISKFYIEKPNLNEPAGSYTPVSITFVSGTQAHVTASNYLLNVNDSGIYDFEGKSGKPFNDRTNED